MTSFQKLTGTFKSKFLVNQSVIQENFFCMSILGNALDTLTLRMVIMTDFHLIITPSS